MNRQDGNGQLVRVEFKDPKAVEKIGFQPIPVENIGPYADPRRASWPVKRTVREVVLPD